MKSCLTELQKFNSGPPPPPPNSLHLPCKYTSIHRSSLFSHLFLFYNDNPNNFYQGPTQLVYTERIKSSWLPKHTSLKKTDSKECYDLQYLYLCHMYVSLTLFIVWFTENLVQYLPERNESLDKNTIYTLKGGVSYQIGLAAY